MVKNNTDQIVSLLEGWFGKLPPLSSKAREIIVTIVPWYAIIFGVLGVISFIGALGVLSSLPAAFSSGGYTGSAGYGLIFGVLGLVSSALLIAAFPGTRAKRARGWKFLFWGELVSVLSAVIAFSVIGVIFGVVGLYLIFQIKSYYK